MQGKKHVTLTLALLIATASGCNSLQDALNLRRPTASLQGFAFDEITLDSASLLFDVEIENPYPVALPLLNVDYDLTSRARSLLSGKADLQGSIAPNSKALVSLPAKITYLDMFQAFKDIRPGSIIPYRADMGLSVDTPAGGLLRLPINQRGEMSVPTIPEISQSGLKKLILDQIQ